MHVVVTGAGSAIAQGVIEHYIYGHRANVTAVYRYTKPAMVDPLLKVVKLSEEITDIDTLITLTGSARNAKLEKMDLGDWQTVMDGCLTSVFLALKTLLPNVKDGGSVVVVGSIVGSTGGYGCANYAAAKAGLEGLVKAAANEMLARKVRVNLLELGYCNVGMGAALPQQVRESVLKTIPMGRFAELDEVVDTIIWLARQTHMTGNKLTFAGGL